MRQKYEKRLINLVFKQINYTVQPFLLFSSLYRKYSVLLYAKNIGSLSCSWNNADASFNMRFDYFSLLLLFFFAFPLLS